MRLARCLNCQRILTEETGCACKTSNKETMRRLDAASAIALIAEVSRVDVVPFDYEQVVARVVRDDRCRMQLAAAVDAGRGVAKAFGYPESVMSSVDGWAGGGVLVDLLLDLEKDLAETRMRALQAIGRVPGEPGSPNLRQAVEAFADQRASASREALKAHEERAHRLGEMIQRRTDAAVAEKTSRLQANLNEMSDLVAKTRDSLLSALEAKPGEYGCESVLGLARVLENRCESHRIRAGELGALKKEHEQVRTYLATILDLPDGKGITLMGLCIDVGVALSRARSGLGAEVERRSDTTGPAGTVTPPPLQAVIHDMVEALGFDASSPSETIGDMILEVKKARELLGASMVDSFPPGLVQGIRRVEDLVREVRGHLEESIHALNRMMPEALVSIPVRLTSLASLVRSQIALLPVPPEERSGKFAPPIIF